MSTTQINSIQQQKNPHPANEAQAVAPTNPLPNSLSSAPPSRSCFETVKTFLQAIIDFIKQKVYCCFFSPSQQEATSQEVPSGPSTSLTHHQNVTIETVQAPLVITQETLERFDGIRRLVEEVRNLVPHFPDDLNSDTVTNHHNQTRRGAFDDIQSAYLCIIALLYPILVSLLEAQRDSQFQLNDNQLEEIRHNHLNENKIKRFLREWDDKMDLQFDQVFGNFETCIGALQCYNKPKSWKVL